MYKTSAYLPRIARQRKPHPVPQKLRRTEQEFLNFANSIPEVEDETKGQFVIMDHDVPPTERLMKSIQDNECPDVMVTVNDRMFLCHRIILCIYSKRMLKLLIHKVTNIVFDSKDLTAKAFSDAYQWMISRDGILNVCDMVDIMKAAYFLDMPELLEACWKTLESHAFDEFSAFRLMYEARGANNLSEIFDKLAERLSRATLPAVSSREFLSLSEMQICSLLKSSSLQVNSEMELLYAALMWLSYYWPQRRSSTNEVLKHIRFGYLPPTMLSKFKTQERYKVGNFGEILEEFSKSPDVNQLVRDGMFDSTLIIAAYNDPGVLEENVEFKQVKLMDPRCWIRDRRCEYHRDVTTLCPNMRFVTLIEFQKYLKSLSMARPDFDRFFEYPGQKRNEKLDSDRETKREINKMMLLKRVVGMDADVDRYIERIKNKRNPKQ